MALLFNADVDGRWPVDAAAFPVGPLCHYIVVGLFPLTGGAYVVLAGWMESVRGTVAAHAPWFGILDRNTTIFSSFVA